MGGYGAWKLGLGASETFGAAASLSGCLDIIEDVGRHLEGDSRMQLCSEEFMVLWSSWKALITI